MVGTEQGGVIITRMQAKAGTNDWVLGEFEKCHQGKVMAVDRNRDSPTEFSNDYFVFVYNNSKYLLSDEVSGILSTPRTS